MQGIVLKMLKSIFGDDSSRFLKKTRPIVEKTGALESAFLSLTPEDFPKKTEKFKKRLADGETLEDILPEVFALAREAAKRTLNQRPFDVQIMGALALHEGKIAEMKTGEGKTLVATLPTYLNALVGKGVHVVTVNDYLARRDTVWMGQIYTYLGLSVGVVCSGNTSYFYDLDHIEKDSTRDQVGAYKVLYDFLRPCSRREAYGADITYGMGSEFGFDYLRDNLVHSTNDLSQRGHYFAIVDEVDSILIDEARTPLIISTQAEESEDFYKVFARIAEGLHVKDDFEIDEKRRAVTLTDNGIEKAEKALGLENIYTEKGIKYVHHLETAVRAKALYLRDRDYVIKDDQVIIVDPFTGRMMPGRRWSEGLHQAIEAKEGVKIERETRAAASITYQNYFRMYEKLSGMTGTAKTSAEEFDKVYGLQVIEIPTNCLMVRADKNDLIFQTETGKFTAVARTVKELHTRGQPVLLGTVSIEKNELLAKYLTREGVPHEILNAKNHEREGEIIAQAGRRGSVTIATNMAGRGVDIKLGGPSTLLGAGASTPTAEYEEVKKLGGLFVIGTERHEARRIDNQLRGRSGRQGDPGATQFFVSLEDDLMRVFGGEGVKKIMGRLGVSEDTPIENKMITKMLESAQERIEGYNFDARKHTLEYDDVLNHQRKIIYERRRAMIGSKTEDMAEFANKIDDENGEFAQILSEKKTALGEEVALTALCRIVLYVTDVLWMEHLETMEYLRNSVGLRAYGQRDPLVEYKKEGLRLFREMEENFRAQVKEFLKSLKTAPPPVGGGAEKHEGAHVHETSRPTIPETKTGRNDPCPCGSGKKYKKCHGKS